MLRKMVLAALLAVAMLAGVAGAQGVLRVGSDVTYPPFEYVDEQTGEFVGFDMDLIREVGRRLGMRVEIINTAWEGIIPGLLSGHYDVIRSAMSITDDRAAAVDFTDPYFATGQVIMVRADDHLILQLTDFAG